MQDGVIVQIVFSGTPVLNLPNWKVSARLKQPISDGVSILPPEKVVLRINRTEGNQAPNGMPSAAQIGIPLEVPLSLSEVFLVPQSNAPFYSTGYSFESRLYFDLQVLPGAYLAGLQAAENQRRRYRLALEVTFYNQNNQVLGTSKTYNCDIDILKLSGTPPVQNSFSLTVGAGAQNGTLTLQSRADYENGASVTYSNGLTVKTGIPYQVTVNASSGTPYFSYQNNSIDLDVLNVKLATVASGVTNLNTITLSTGPQVIAKGPSTSNNNLNFDVGYSINPAHKDKLMYAFKDNQQTSTTYTTTLQYTLLAQ